MRNLTKEQRDEWLDRFKRTCVPEDSIFHGALLDLDAADREIANNQTAQTAWREQCDELRAKLAEADTQIAAHREMGHRVSRMLADTDQELAALRAVEKAARALADEVHMTRSETVWTHEQEQLIESLAAVDALRSKP